MPRTSTWDHRTTAEARLRSHNSSPNPSIRLPFTGSPLATPRLAIPDIETGQILARTVLAANISHSTYADVINNLIAVVGWAEWHRPQPVVPPTAGTRAFSRLAEYDRHDQVHVLRTGRGATWVKTSAHDVSSGPGQVRPHRRRGHWRRQHHGPGNHLLKWIRIAPTIVNAHAGPLTPQIYRLPPAGAARS